MMRASLPIGVCLLTIAAAVSLPYAGASVRIGGLMDYGFTAADVIGERAPLHLVPIAWVSGSSEGVILMRWGMMEEKVRMMLVVVLWIVSVSFFSWLYLRKRKYAVETPKE